MKKQKNLLKNVILKQMSKICIRLDLPEIDQLSKELNLPKEVIGAMVNVWSSRNNEYSRWPTKEELNFKENKTNSLFGVENNKQPLEFRTNTLNAVTNFLEGIGVETRLVPNFLNADGNIVEGAIAAANFMEGTVDILDEMEKRPSAWNKIPEEAAHWWYRLLKQDSDMFYAFNSFATHEASNKIALRAKNLPEYSDANYSMQDLREEAIGQLISEAIKKIENGTASDTDYSFFKKFLEWLNTMIKKLNFFKENDPFEVAAIKILASDYSDMFSLEEYNQLNNIHYFNEKTTNASINPVNLANLSQLGEIKMFNTGENVLFRWDGKIGSSSSDFESIEEVEQWIYANVLSLYSPEELQQMQDTEEFVSKILNGSLRKRTKFLPKTLKKYFKLYNTGNRTEQLPVFNTSFEKLEVTKKLSEYEKTLLKESTNYSNITPTLKVLPDVLKKYKNTPISLSEPLKIDGAKKQELNILNTIKDMIKEENPSNKSISAEEFVNEVHTWLETQYLLGFGNEQSHLTYRIDQTFKNVPDRSFTPGVDEDADITNMTEEELRNLPVAERQRIANVLGLTKKNPQLYHNKISIRFNDTYHKKHTHFQYSPSAWGNLTYFYTGNHEYKDAVLLHEIQNDNIEHLREQKEQNIDLDKSLAAYLTSINNKARENIEGLKQGGVRIDKREDLAIKQLGEGTLQRHINDTKFDPIPQSYNALISSSEEIINLYDNGVGLKQAEEELGKLYSNKNIFRNIIKSGGIVQYLSEEDITAIKDLVIKYNSRVDLNFEQKQSNLRSDLKFYNDKINGIVKLTYNENAPQFFIKGIRKATPRRKIRNLPVSELLSDNVGYMLINTQKQVLEQSEKELLRGKKKVIGQHKYKNKYNYALKLAKINLEQYQKMVENFRANESLLNRSIELLAQQSRVSFVATINDNKEEYILKEQEKLQKLEAEAIEKKAKLEENYGKAQEELQDILEVEMGYFTPLVHHLIQTHIDKYGKDFPMYFSGYNITKLTQGNTRTAMIYAGKDEINIVGKSAFTFGENNYEFFQGEFEYDERYYKGTKLQLPEDYVSITKQEYEKVYQQATELKAKEIKYEAAKQIGIIPLISNGEKVSLEEGVKKLNDYKKQSRQNLDRVINTIMNVSNDKPIETGAIYNAMSQISGVKLVWQENVPGIQNNVGGYLVDLSDYNYKTPILYAIEKDNSIPMFSPRPLNSYNRLQQTQFKDNIKEGDVVSFRYWSETTSAQEGNKNVVITKVDEDRFYGYYADSKEPRIFKYSNIINDSVNGTISIPEIFAYKKNLAEGKKVSLDTVNGKVEGVIDEVGSDGFRIGETYTLFKDILASKEVDKIKTLVNKLKVDLEDKIKTFSKNTKTELQLKRIADLKDAYQALDGFTEVGDLVDFFKKIRSQVEITNSLMDNLSEEPSEMLHSLSFIHNYIKSFETIRELEQLLPKGTEVRKVANFLKSSLDNTLFKYREKAVPALAKWMWDYFPQTLNEELAKVGEEPWDLDRLISELQQPTTDLDMFNKFLVPVINSNDVIAGLFSKTLKAHLQKKDHLALTLQKSLVEIVNKLKEKGLNAIEVSKSFYKLVSEKDEEGNIKYYRQFIEKYDTSTFYDELKKLRKLRNEAYISFKSADKENRKSLLQEYFSAKDNLESYLKDKANTSSSFEMSSIMNNLRKYDPTKYQKFLDMFYTKGSTTQDPNSLRLVEDKINEDGETTQEVVYYTYKKNHYTPILEKFINKDYEKLISNPLVKDYYELLKDAYDKADAKLPFHKRLNGRVPVTYKKESLLSLDGLKAYFTNFWKSNKTQDLTNYNGETYKTLTVPFTAKIEDKNASDNILFSTYMFITEAEYFKIKNDNLGAVEIIQDILNTTPKNSVSNLRKESVVKFLDQVFFNQTGETSIPSKMIDLLGASTAVSRMALSFNAVTNAIVGNVANYAEALGARNYTLEDYNKGVSMYFKLLKNDKDKLFNILNSIDAIQGSFRNNKGEPFKSNAQNVSWSNLMFAQDAGEHQIQGSVALALLLKKNITIPEDGIIDINTLPSNFIDTLHEINKSNHGVYNSFDKLYLQDQATFRLFLQFRKWVIPTFRSRYSGLFSKGKDKYRVDLESGTVEMGYYRAFWDYFINNCKDIEGLLTNWKNLSPMEKEGVIRTFKDMVMAITTTMLIFLLSGGDDGEDKGIADNFMLYQLTRLRSEIGAYIPILGAEDQERLVNEPFATYSTFRDARKLVQMIISPLFNPLREEKDRTSWFDEYERSTSFAEKGDNKLLYRFNKINPLFNIYEGLSPEIQLENFNKVSR